MSTNKDYTEFFIDGDIKHRLMSSHRLVAGDLVNIQKISYKVTAVSYALDQSADEWSKSLVQCVVLKKLTGKS